MVELMTDISFPSFEIATSLSLGLPFIAFPSKLLSRIGAGILAEVLKPLVFFAAPSPLKKESPFEGGKGDVRGLFLSIRFCFNFLRNS